MPWNVPGQSCYQKQCFCVLVWTPWQQLTRTTTPPTPLTFDSLWSCKRESNISFDKRSKAQNFFSTSLAKLCLSCCVKGSSIAKRCSLSIPCVHVNAGKVAMEANRAIWSPGKENIGAWMPPNTEPRSFHFKYSKYKDVCCAPVQKEALSGSKIWLDGFDVYSL